MQLIWDGNETILAMVMDCHDDGNEMSTVMAMKLLWCQGNCFYNKRQYIFKVKYEGDNIHAIQVLRLNIVDLINSSSWPINK